MTPLMVFLIVFQVQSSLGSGSKGRALEEVWEDLGEERSSRMRTGAASALERIKQTILEQLGLEKPPPRHLRRLPQPPGLFPTRSDPVKRQNLYLHPKEYTCVESENGNLNWESIFDLPAFLEANGLISAQLRVHHGSVDSPHEAQCSLTSFPCVDGETQTPEDEKNNTFEIPGGWSQLDLKKSLRGWLEFRNLCKRLKAICESSESTSSPLTCPVEDGKRPFITITADVSIKPPRPKRNSNCTTGTTECCRENLIVSFKEIGWDNWIIGPPEFNAYHCKGQCSRSTSVTKNTYGAVIEIMKQHKMYRELDDSTSCCAPKSYSSQFLVYQLSNGTIYSSQTPNLVVESCECI